MTGRAGVPLRLVTVAFGATALLIVLQTVVFQLLPYDSSAIGRVSTALRVGFWLADVTMLMSLATLARAEPAQRGLLAVGATLAAFAVLSGLLGLGANALGSDARVLHEMGRATSGAEPVVSIGAALLATLALGALAIPYGSKATARARLVTIAVAISVSLSLGFRIVRLVDAGQRSLTSAWASWFVEVTRPALVALLALSLARAIGRAAPTGARPEGPYRAAGEGAPLPVTKEPIDAATIESLRAVARALSSYRRAFLARVGAAVATTFVAFVVAFMKHADGMLIVLGAIPLASLATALPLALSLTRLLALPRGVRARGVTLGAILAIGFAGLVDAGTLIFAVSTLFESSWYRATRDFAWSVFAPWPVVALAGGVSLLFTASALRRLGERLGDDRVVGRARWVQGMAIGAGAAQIGAVLAAPWNDASSAGVPLVIAGLTLTALAATVAVMILHVLLASATRSSVLAEIGEAPRAG